MKIKKGTLAAAFLLLTVLHLYSSETGMEPRFPHDENAELDNSINGKKSFGYILRVFDSQVQFRDGQERTQAQYNWKQQYWIRKSNSFKPEKLNLENLFSKINLKKTKLDRPYPQDTWKIDTDLQPSKNYNPKNDRDFINFLSFSEKCGTSKDHLDFFMNAASISAHRGKLLTNRNSEVYYADEVGIQYENLKPVKYKERHHDQVPDNLERSAGGMEYYISTGSGKYLRLADSAYNIFRDNKTVPVMLVELEPEKGSSSKDILRGEELRKEAEYTLESYFYKDFTVYLETMKVNYAAYDTIPLNQINNLFKKEVNSRWGDKILYIYYFTNTEGLLKIDKKASHPVHLGAYGGHWDRYKATIVHELGHTLGMRHHFTRELPEYFTDSKQHCSPACVMNYAREFKADEFCSLCLYSLGVPADYVMKGRDKKSWMLNYDSQAAVNTLLDGKSRYGYTLDIYGDIVAFKTGSRAYALYNWKKQHWIQKNTRFSPKNLKLNQLFNAVESTIELDRTKEEFTGTAEKRQQDKYKNISSPKKYKPSETTDNSHEENLPPRTEGFTHDPDAQADTTLDNQQKYGYLMDIMGDMVVFKHRSAGTFYAMYNWKNQYWNMKRTQFNPMDLDLKELFTTIDLRKTKLDRTKAEFESEKAALASSQQEETPRTTSNQTEENSSGTASSEPAETAAPTYDPNAQFDRALNGKMKYGYRLRVFGSQVQFRTTSESTMAQYNWQKQYWIRKAPDFSPQNLNLEELFTRINTDITILDRGYPGNNLKPGTP